MKKVDVYYDYDNPPASFPDLIAEARLQAKAPDAVCHQVTDHGRDPRFFGHPIRYEVVFDD